MCCGKKKQVMLWMKVYEKSPSYANKATMLNYESSQGDIASTSGRM